ncbi:GNAT family N-acetyltransferase, partial [Streptomyces sp. NPDC059082]
MTDVTSSKSTRRPHHWRHDLIELAALFTAVVVADTIAKTVVKGPDGPYLLVFSAIALAATATFHTWWARRHGHAGHAPPTDDTGGHPAPEPAAAPERDASAPPVETTVWRMRTTVADTPGSLAALCTALARLRVDILTLQTHPLGDGTVDEFLLRAPADLSAGGRGGRRAGGAGAARVGPPPGPVARGPAEGVGGAEQRGVDADAPPGAFTE